jgi:uracil-DNA glycosylase
MESLYAEMFACSTCFGATGCQITPDPERVRRRVLARTLSSKVFVVGQALSRKAQRKSGLPYVLPNGRLTQARLGASWTRFWAHSITQSIRTANGNTPIRPTSFNTTLGRLDAEIADQQALSGTTARRG